VDLKKLDLKKYVSSVYDKSASSYAKEYPRPSEHIDKFLENLKKLHSHELHPKILDIGCGIGKDSGYMHSQGFGVIGIDISKGMLKVAKKNFPKIDFRLADFRHVDFLDNSFDGIFAAYSLIHIPKSDILKTLKRLNRFMKAHGFIYIALQSGKPNELFVNLAFASKEKVFLNVYSYSEIKEILNKVGFKIIFKSERAPKKNEIDYKKLFIIAQKI